jgi:hypothetical protein
MLEFILAMIIVIGICLEGWMVVTWKYDRDFFRDLLFVGTCLITVIASVALLVLIFL